MIRFVMWSALVALLAISVLRTSLAEPASDHRPRVIFMPMILEEDDALVRPRG